MPRQTTTQPAYIERFNGAILRLFTDALRICHHDLSFAPFLVRTLARQKMAVRRRRHWARKGLGVPPFLIFSITRRCNLRCAGCYSHALSTPSQPEISAERLRGLVAEADELGFSIILIAGGEPLTRREILEITADFPHILFPFFTNGLLLDSATVQEFKRQRHLIPILSLEGHQGQTDSRRGSGVHRQVLDRMRLMGTEGLFFGASLTLTRENYDVLLEEDFVRDMIQAGCKAFVYVDYVPIQAGTDELILTEEQRAEATSRLSRFSENLPALFIALPGDEEQYGGCLAAGRGFVHISPEGNLEPCPFSPYSDVNLNHQSLREALDSPLLSRIRENAGELSETRGGCALWARREWVGSLLTAPSDAA